MLCLLVSPLPAWGQQTQTPHSVGRGDMSHDPAVSLAACRSVKNPNLKLPSHSLLFLVLPNPSQSLHVLHPVFFVLPSPPIIMSFTVVPSSCPSQSSHHSVLHSPPIILSFTVVPSFCPSQSSHHSVLHSRPIILSFTVLPSFCPSQSSHHSVLHSRPIILSFTVIPSFCPSQSSHHSVLHSRPIILSFTVLPSFCPSQSSHHFVVHSPFCPSLISQFFNVLPCLSFQLPNRIDFPWSYSKHPPKSTYFRHDLNVQLFLLT